MPGTTHHRYRVDGNSNNCRSRKSQYHIENNMIMWDGIYADCLSIEELNKPLFTHNSDTFSGGKTASGPPFSGSNMTSFK